MYFGKDCVRQYLGQLLESCGKTVLLAYGCGSVKKNGIYDQIMSELKAADKSVVEFAGIMPNPTYAKVQEGAALVRENHVDFILAVGDALAHGIEGYLNRYSRPTEKIWHDYGFSLFSTYKDHLLNKTLNFEDYEQMLTASTIQGMAVMQSGTTIPHGLGYTLTHFKHVPHGLASCMTTAAYLESLKNQTPVEHILTACGFDSFDAFRDYLRQIIERNVSITVTQEEIEHWTDMTFAVKNRLDRTPEPVTREGLRTMYMRSLQSVLN